jgi:phosphoenolpyruvate-protein phosphotransferase
MSRRLTARGAAPGVALAPVAIIRPQTVADDTPLGSPEQERARLDDALARAADQLRELAERISEEVGEDEGEIFEAHAEFADDPELASRARATVADGRAASVAVTEAFGSFRELLEASGSEYLAARAADLDDVRDRVLTLLAGGAFEIEAPTVPSVIVAHELSPSQTASIPREVIEALVTETGSPTSHAAILARSLGVPAVVGATGVVDLAGDGVEMTVDGRTGELVLDPDDDQRARAAQRLEEERQRREELAGLRDELGRTADGRRVELAANIGSAEDLEVAVEAGAEGSGLVRTEFLYLDRISAPTVTEQAEFIEQVLRTFPGHRVVVRTLDVGADKPLPFVAREEEPNPALGMRGIRMSLARPGMFRDQLRALLAARATVGDEGARLAIMFPLISLPAELTEARRHLAEVAAEEGHDLEGLEVGVMVETPAAALAAGRLAEQCDFLSVGTNDLLQYLFAADRMVAGVGEIADACDPVVLDLLADVVDAAHRHGAWVGVCGEAASDPAVAVALVGLDIDELSMTRVAIPEVKATLRGLTRDQCRQALVEARERPDAAAARDVLSATGG